MAGILLLAGSGGRSSLVCDWIGVVSVRLRLANLDGGGGLDPEGLDDFWPRKSWRY